METRNNRSGYKVWMTQKKNQAKFDSMNRAVMAQMQQEAASQQNARMGMSNEQMMLGAMDDQYEEDDM